MGKKKKRKGYRRKGKKKGRVSRKTKKPGLAETLGILKSVYDTEMEGTLMTLQKNAILHPSKASLSTAVNSSVAMAKLHTGPAIVGVVVSNIDIIPIVGKMARPLKTRADRIMKRFTGMKL